MFGLNALWAPGKAFEGVKESPTGSWLYPALFMVGVIFAVNIFHFSRVDVVAEMRTTIEATLAEQGQEVPPELESMLPAMAYGSLAVGLAFVPLMLLIFSFVTWLITKIGGGQATFGQGLGIVVHAKMPSVLLAILGVPIALLHSQPPGFAELGSLVKQHPAALMGLEAQSPWFGLSTMFGVFSLWSLALLILGTAQVAGISRGKSALAWGGMFLASAGVLTALAFLAQSAQQLG